MILVPSLPSLLCALAPLASSSAATDEITTASLLDELADLERLTHLPDPPYRTVQYSSTDRRSKSMVEPDWFSNADGFGGEPIPGFEEVLREPDETGVGRYLVCDVESPGAIVRGWSAGMGGTWTVTLDGAEKPVYEGEAYKFLARRTQHFLDEAGIAFDTGDALMQQDSDYFPIPFAKRVRVTWEGNISQLHFYHLELRLYEAGVAVQPFAGVSAMAELKPVLEGVVDRLLVPRPIPSTKQRTFDWRINPQIVDHTPFIYHGKPGAITELTVKLEADDVEAALRGMLLRIAFDTPEKAQVLAPVGDFFASGIGVNPYDSLPFTVEPDGTMRCRWPMPYESGFTLFFHNATTQSVRVLGSIAVADRPWDDGSLHFHAGWRHDPAIDLVGKDPIDLTFLRATGEGRFVGVTSILLNPSRCPTPWGNWWGEGDEKVFVDGESYPSFLGTGSEDYYNYSWSRADLFEHPYCGQPQDTGPGNAGYVVNFRWHILDDVPYRRSLLFLMELWHHQPAFPISYARTAYWYARPGGTDDFPEPQFHEVIVPKLPRWEPEALLGSANSVFHRLETCVVEKQGVLGRADEPLASQGSVADWKAKAGERIEFTLPIDGRGEYGINLVARHVPEGATIRVLLDGEPLPLASTGGAELSAGGDVEVTLRSRFVTRLLSLGFAPRELDAGEHRLVFECVEEGEIAFDYLWVKTRRLETFVRAGGVEAEGLDVTPTDPGVEWQTQGMEQEWSGGAHLWGKATAEGQGIDVAVPVAEAGSYRVKVYLTKSWDYGVLQLSIDGEPLGDPVDTWSPHVVLAPEVDLGVHDLAGEFTLGVRLVGTNPESRAPHYYFGIDGIVLEPIDEKTP